MRKRCAKEAFKLINNNSIIGLGGGLTISYLVSYIKESNLNVKIVTPSFSTEKLCIENNLNVIPTWSADSIDIAFDGCDEVDLNLNALKSGGGIHTKEKIIASMAKEYVLLVDESKVSKRLTFEKPIVLEILPESLSYVKRQVEALGGKVSMRHSSSKDGLTVSDNGLYLMDAYFDKNNIENIEILNNKLRDIIGVLGSSLFYNIATRALVVSESGVRVIENKESRKSL